MTKDYTQFQGEYVEEISKFANKKLAPASVADIIESRLKADPFFVDGPFGPLGWKYDEEGQFLMDNSFATSDLIVQNSEYQKKEIKLIMTTNNENKITKNGLQFYDFISKSKNLISREGIDFMENYESLNGNGIINISINWENQNYTLLKGKEILDNNLFRVLARHPDEVPKEFAKDKDILKEYLRLINLKRIRKDHSREKLGFTRNTIGYGSRLKFLSIDPVYSQSNHSFIRGYGCFLNSGEILLGQQPKKLMLENKLEK